jgi:hypothetical protein
MNKKRNKGNEKKGHDRENRERKKTETCKRIGRKRGKNVRKRKRALR